MHLICKNKFCLLTKEKKMCVKEELLELEDYCSIPAREHRGSLWLSSECIFCGLQQLCLSLVPKDNESNGTLGTC